MLKVALKISQSITQQILLNPKHVNHVNHLAKLAKVLMILVLHVETLLVLELNRNNVFLNVMYIIIQRFRLKTYALGVHLLVLHVKEHLIVVLAVLLELISIKKPVLRNVLWLEGIINIIQIRMGFVFIMVQCVSMVTS